MKTLNANLIVEKNTLYSAAPWIVLLEVGIDSSTTWYLAAYPEDVTFNGQAYTAIPAIVETIGEDSSGNLGTLNVHVANVDRTVSAYVENANILGQDVTVKIVHADYLTTAAANIAFTYRVNKIHVTAEFATFELGHEDLMAVRLPRQRYIRGKCRFVYKDSHCNYPSDDFELTTKQTLYDERTTGSPFTKLYGWSIYQPDRCSACDVSVTTEGLFTITNHAPDTIGARQWIDTTTDGAYAYKSLSGDFDVHTYLYSTSISTPGVGVIFMIADNATVGEWVGWRWRAAVDTAGTNQLHSISTTDDTTGSVATLLEDTSGNLFHRYVRIARSGSTITWYSKAASGDSWTEQRSATRADIGSTVRIGFASTTESAAAATALQFSYLTFTSGGLAACDYTLDGANGCRMHNNTANYGGFPALPYGRLYGI